MRWLAAFCAFMAASANAAAQQPRAIDVAYVLVEALPATIDTQPRSAVAGDILFSQDVRVTEAVRLDAYVPAYISTTRQRLEAGISAGSLLYRVAFESDESVRAYCSLETITIERDRPLLPATARFCLSDNDNDGGFDQLWTMQVAVSSRREGDAVVRDPAPPFNGDIVRDGGVIQRAPYAVLDTHDIPPTTLRVAADRDSRGMLLRINAFHHDVQTNVSARSVHVPTTALPQTVEILGARIDVLTQEPNSFRYRVVHGFPEGETLRIGAPAPPAIPVIMRR
jgi:hypothetical protein